MKRQYSAWYTLSRLIHFHPRNILLVFITIMFNILRKDIWCLVNAFNWFPGFFLTTFQIMLLSKSLFVNFPPPTQRVFSNNLVFVLFHSLITHSVLFEIQRCSPGVREDIEKLDACKQNTLGKRKRCCLH